MKIFFSMMVSLLCSTLALAGPGITFKETLKGYTQLETEKIPITVDLSMTIGDIDKWEKDPYHPIEIEGWFGDYTPEMLDIMGLTLTGEEKERIPVRGLLQFMFAGENSHYLRYLLWSANQSSPAKLSFVGQKVIHDDPGFDILTDLTLLQGVTTWEGACQSKRLPTSLQFPYKNPLIMGKFLSSIQVTGARNLLEHFKTKKRFLKIWFQGVTQEFPVPYSSTPTN